MPASGSPISARAARGRRVRHVCLALIAILYVASVPWYREAGAPLGLWLGLPDWVAVALLCYVAVAFLNALAWLVTDVSDELDSNESRKESGSLDRSEAPR